MANVTRTVRKASLKSWVELLTPTAIGGSDGVTVYWDGVPRGWQSMPIATCTLPQPIGLGTDEIIDDVDLGEPSGSEVRQYQTGQRQQTLSIKIETFQASGDADATVFAARVRNRLRLRDGKTLLDTAGLAFASITLDLAVQGSTDERDNTARQLDILFNDVSTEEGTAVGYLETLEDAEMQTPEGTTKWTGDIPVGSVP